MILYMPPFYGGIVITTNFLQQYPAKGKLYTSLLEIKGKIMMENTILYFISFKLVQTSFLE